MVECCNAIGGLSVDRKAAVRSFAALDDNARRASLGAIEFDGKRIEPHSMSATWDVQRFILRHYPARTV